MKTLLVLAEHPELAETVRGAVNPEHYRILHRGGLEEAEPLLAHGMVDACLVDDELSSVQSLWFLEKLKAKAPHCPVIIYTSTGRPEWEEEAYLLGAAHVLTKPVRPRMLASLLDRLWTAAPPAPAEAPQPPPPKPPVEPPPPELPPSHTNAEALAVLRNFSGILTHSLDAKAMFQEFLLLVRELLGINRAAIFLRQDLAARGLALPAPERNRLMPTCAVGVPASLVQSFALSLGSGIGGHLFRSGRILRRSSEATRVDAQALREFELLGTEVAVPILDRETVIGVGVFDCKITGEPLVNGELGLIFHLLEQLGLALKNIWLHDQVASNHAMLAEVLRELSSACVVISRDLLILHANKAARRYFTLSDRRGGELRFEDLPQVLGSRVYQVLRTGAALANFRYTPEESPSLVYNVTVVPFQRQTSGQPASALLMMEDLTQKEQLQRLEIEAANLRLVKTMADRLAHEVGNAMVPLSTHQQLLADKFRDPEFRASLDTALAEGVKRVTRLINQMRFLARDALAVQEAFPLVPLIEEAYQEARKYQAAKTPQLKCEAGAKPIVLTGDRAALKHALAEILLNALQANPADPKVGVRLQADPNGNGTRGLSIEVQDNGSGFTAESAEKASAPFFTTRNVGLGLGLTVSRKIIETHHGTLEIVPPKPGESGVVRISLPADVAPGATSGAM